MSSMRIKRKLPPAPRTATSSVRHEGYTGTGVYTHESKPMRTPLDEFRLTDQTKYNAHIGQIEASKSRRELAMKMAVNGVSDEDISKATGYTKEYVRKLRSKWKTEGIDIPEKKRGRRCKEQRE